MALPKMKLLIFRISDQNLWNQAKKIQNPLVDFFVNSPVGADHSLKCVKLKSATTFALKTFENKQL